jgi:hypothetical protein
MLTDRGRPLETAEANDGGGPPKTEANAGLGWRRPGPSEKGVGGMVVGNDGGPMETVASNGRELPERIVGDDKGPPNMVN